MLQLQSDFSRFKKARSGELHFAAHSHHFWPDVSFEAQSRYWKIAEASYDDKWNEVFGDLLAKSAAEIARELHLSSAKTLAFGQNTHELFFRLLTCFPLGKKKISVLTTDSEFHSAFRQLGRLVEDGYVEATTVAARPFETFQQRFEAAANAQNWDLIFLSQVFFDSGFVVRDLSRLTNIAHSARAEAKPMIVVDGYHAFMAMPVDLSEIQGHVFYLGGGYKYAMAGEGACFLHIPEKAALRPLYTGWFSEMDHLSGDRHALGSQPTGYAKGGAGFLGATFDATPWCRFLAVQDWRQAKGLTTETTHAHVMTLQDQFLEGIRARPNVFFQESERLEIPKVNQGAHFLTFKAPNAADRVAALRKKGIWTDFRGDCLRVGFGIYHSEKDVQELLERTRS